MLKNTGPKPTRTRRGTLRAGAAAVCACALLLLLAPACGGGGGSGGGVIEDMLRLLPRDAEGAFYIDVAALYDDDLRSIRRDAEDDWEDAELEDEFGIELEDFTEVVFGETDGDDLFMLYGLDDLDDLRDELDDLDYDDDEIRGVEVWIDTSRYWEAVAFLDGGRVLIAEYEETMEDVLRRMERESSSLYDEVEDIVSDLPGGVLALVRPCGSDCLLASALQKRGSDDMKLVQIALYEDEDDAEDEEDDIQDDIDDDDIPTNCDDAGVDRSGRKVTFEMVCDLEAFKFFARFDL